MDLLLLSLDLILSRGKPACHRLEEIIGAPRPNEDLDLLICVIGVPQAFEGLRERVGKVTLDRLQAVLPRYGPHGARPSFP